MMVSGELVLIEENGETLMRPGDCATHKAGVANGHHLVNRSGSPATFLVVGRARRARSRIIRISTFWPRGPERRRPSPGKTGVRFDPQPFSPWTDADGVALLTWDSPAAP